MRQGEGVGRDGPLGVLLHAVEEVLGYAISRCHNVAKTEVDSRENPGGRCIVKSSDLIAVSMFRSTADAQIAKGVLDEAGIDSMIRADNAGGMYPAISGAELLVRSEDIDKAQEALQQRDAGHTSSR